MFDTFLSQFLHLKIVETPPKKLKQSIESEERTALILCPKMFMLHYAGPRHSSV